MIGECLVMDVATFVENNAPRGQYHSHYLGRINDKCNQQDHVNVEEFGKSLHWINDQLPVQT